ncbi:MAG: restriction endonuclease [Pirellulales bacterium]
MAIYLSCPHCQSLLLIPENCGGQTTKCPNCSDDFVIPGDHATTSATPICAVLAPVEGKVTEADLRRARDVLDRLTAENVGLEVELARRRRRRNRLAVRLAWLARFQAGRQALDHTVGRGGGFFLAVTIGAAAFVVLFSLFSLSAFGYFFVAVMGLLAAGAAYIPFSYYPDDAKLALAIQGLTEKLAEAGKLHDQLAGEEGKHRAKLAAAEEEYGRVQAALASRLHWLRTCQWKQMTSRNFVNFLKQVFEEHGYTVEPTGKKGQAGIDLVITRDGTRVAVQAKGSPKEPVDSKVVEQTHAGKITYRCQLAAVITNAQFAPSARQLAERTGCKLIDSSQIADLIEGRMVV